MPVQLLDGMPKDLNRRHVTAIYYEKGRYLEYVSTDLNIKSDGMTGPHRTPLLIALLDMTFMCMLENIFANNC